MPLPWLLKQVFLTQHWMFAAPGQWLVTEKPSHEEVDRHVPEPSGVVQVVRGLSRSAGLARIWVVASARSTAVWDSWKYMVDVWVLEVRGVG